MATSTKVLRACVVERGRILEEKRLEAGEALTIGTAPKNTFVVTDDIGPKDDGHTLIAQRNGAYELVLESGMSTKLLVEGRELDVDGLRSAGLLSVEADTQRVRLADEIRGKVHVGPYTVVFQFSAPLPAARSMPLPAELKPNYLKNLDRFYALTLASTTVLALLLIFWFQFVPQPAEVTFETMDDRWAKLIVPDYVPERPRAEEKPKGDQPPPKRDEAKEKIAKPEENADPAQAKAARAEKIRKSIQGQGVLAILGTRGAGASGAVADVFRDSNINSDLDTAFEGISGVGIASTGAPGARGGGTSGAGDAASIGGIATSGGGQVGLGGKKEARVAAAAVKTEAPEVDGSLDGDAIAKVVRARLRSIQDCYERELKRDGSLQGKIEIEFTIGGSGEVEDARVSANKMGSTAVGDCIVARVRRWRFPQPDGGRVTVNYPFIFTPSS